MTDTATPGTDEATIDPETRALLLNDMSGLSKATIGRMVAALADRMGIDPALAPVDILVDKKANDGRGAIRLYINARGAAELAKRHDLSDADLDVDIRDAVVIVKVTKVDPATGRRLMDVGASPYKPDWPDSLAGAVKKATTSAHRRATMRMVGVFLTEPADPGSVVDIDG